MKHAILLGVLLSGCASSPSISVLGAFFPDWMFCILGAMVATAVIHVALRAAGKLSLLGQHPLPLIYAPLTTVLALVGWLTFFMN